MSTNLNFVDIAFDSALPERYVLELLEIYTEGLTVSELGRRIRTAADCRQSADAAHMAVDELLRSGRAVHMKSGPSRVIRLVAGVEVTA